MVPKNLTYSQLQQRRKVHADFLPWILENDEYLNRIITGDESYDFSMTLRTMQNMQWKSPGLHLPKKVQMSESKVRTMLICFFDCKESVHQEFFPLVRLWTTGSISTFWNVWDSGFIVWCQNCSLTNGSCTMTTHPHTQYSPSLRFWQKVINFGAGTPNLLTRSCSLGLLPLFYHEESSQDIAIWNCGRDYEGYNSHSKQLKRELWKCFDSWKQCCYLWLVAGGNCSEGDHCSSE